MNCRARCCVLVPAREWVSRGGKTKVASLDLLDSDVT